MLVKIDIEKTYDTLSWTAILATLAKMDFSNTWISWIKTCLNSISFSFIINDFSAPWISSSCSGRYYLFLLLVHPGFLKPYLYAQPCSQHWYDF